MNEPVAGKERQKEIPPLMLELEKEMDRLSENTKRLEAELGNSILRSVPTSSETTAKPDRAEDDMASELGKALVQRISQICRANNRLEDVFSRIES